MLRESGGLGGPFGQHQCGVGFGVGVGDCAQGEVQVDVDVHGHEMDGIVRGHEIRPAGMRASEGPLARTRIAGPIRAGACAGGAGGAVIRDERPAFRENGPQARWSARIAPEGALVTRALGGVFTDGEGVGQPVPDRAGVLGRRHVAGPDDVQETDPARGQPLVAPVGAVEVGGDLVAGPCHAPIGAVLAGGPPVGGPLDCVLPRIVRALVDGHGLLDYIEVVRGAGGGMRAVPRAVPLVRIVRRVQRALEERENGDSPVDLGSGARREGLVAVMVRLQRQPDLFEIAPTLGAAGCLASRLDGRQQQGDQDPDDGDDHQKFDERESTSAVREHG